MQELKKKHPHVFRLNGPSESAHGNGSWAMEVQLHFDKKKKKSGEENDLWLKKKWIETL